MFLHIQQSLFVSRTQRGIAVFRPTSAKCSEKPISIHLLEKVDLITFGLLLPAPIHLLEKVDLITFGLLLPDENIHRYSVEVPLGANLVLKEALVWLLYILWQVRKEKERWNTCLVQLHAVLDLDIFTLD